jgi:hypothetical protein
MINMEKEHLPYFSLAAAQGLLHCSLESSQITKHLNNNDRKHAIQIINKIVYQIVPKY